MELHQNSRILYLGPEGSYSELAASNFFPDSRLTPVDNFEEIYQQMSPHDFAVIPVENSIGGSVHIHIDELFSGKYWITRELFLPINHSLLGKKNVAVNEITKIFLHPQTRAQCSLFLAQNSHWEQKIVSSNSEAARLVAESPDNFVATIAGNHTAQQYNLAILQSRVSNVKENSTRFVVIRTRRDEKFTGEQARKKYSIVFELPHETGSLAHVLNQLVTMECNLTKIESRPNPDYPWSYFFMIDFINVYGTDISALLRVTENIQVIGVYEQGTY